MGRSERAIWGLCQGSGAKPYQTRVDLSEPAFKCSCPSRKFPCKHGLGLLLLFAKTPGAFAQAEEPAWVAEWLAERTDRAEKKAERSRAAEDKPVDAEAQAKRAAQRQERVRDGVAGCRVWLEDLVRRGLAACQGESGSSWDRMAARMVDAQAPGLAGLVRQVPGLIASGEGWEVRTLDHVGRLHLLLKAGERSGELPTELASEARTALGWTHAKEDVLAGQEVADRWMVLGQVVEAEDRLNVRRTWLVGRATARRALVLDFATGLAPLDTSVVAGTEFDGALVFYPARLPLRALVKSRSASHVLNVTLGGAADGTIETGLRRYAESLAANPWLARWPLALAEVRLARVRDRWFLVDGRDAGLPVHASFASGMQLWRLVSVSGGKHVSVLAEWDGFSAQPLGAIHENGYIDLAPRWAA
ncbi:MAG: SWIM zinc finger family protein [Phycisphaeraceae bacterium]|nr:SWIM zinc finger family protein [Phycisphaeraceae bacterium]